MATLTFDHLWDMMLHNRTIDFLKVLLTAYSTYLKGMQPTELSYIPVSCSLFRTRTVPQPEQWSTLYNRPQTLTSSIEQATAALELWGSTIIERSFESLTCSCFLTRSFPD